MKTKFLLFLCSITYLSTLAFQIFASNSPSGLEEEVNNSSSLAKQTETDIFKQDSTEPSVHNTVPLEENKDNQKTDSSYSIWSYFNPLSYWNSKNLLET